MGVFGGFAEGCPSKGVSTTTTLFVFHGAKRLLSSAAVEFVRVGPHITISISWKGYDSDDTVSPWYLSFLTAEDRFI